MKTKYEYDERYGHVVSYTDVGGIPRSHTWALVKQSWFVDVMRDQDYLGCWSAREYFTMTLDKALR